MIVIAAILEKGDVILRWGVEYKIIKVDKEKVIFTTNNDSLGGYVSGYKMQSIGVGSKEKIILLKDCDYGDPKNIHKKMSEVIIEN